MAYKKPDYSNVIKADNPVEEHPTDVNELAIWWLSQQDCEIIIDEHPEDDIAPDILPGYLKIEFRSRYGRPGRGRLWVSIDEDFKVNDISWPEPETPLAKHCGLCGGIVMWRKDLDALSILPGIVTDMFLNRL